VPVKGGMSPCRSSQRAKLPKRHFSFWEPQLVVAKQLTVFSRQNQLLQNRLRFDFHFCAYIGKKKKWTNGLGVFIVVGSQPF
jgi:hypothetical protein